METRIPSSSSSSLPPPPPPTPPPADAFTTTELDAAEQLVQLSESTGESPEASASVSSSSPRSVSTRGNFAPPLPPEAAEDDEDEDEVGGLRRRNKRYRLINDVYSSTAPIVAKKGFPEKRQQKTKKKGG